MTDRTPLSTDPLRRLANMYIHGPRVHAKAVAPASCCKVGLIRGRSAEDPGRRVCDRPQGRGRVRTGDEQVANVVPRISPNIAHGHACLERERDAKEDDHRADDRKMFAVVLAGQLRTGGR